MNTEQTLHSRSDSSCELCKSKDGLSVHHLAPDNEDNPDKSILVCGSCSGQIEDPATMDANHWRCLNDSMWSEVPAVQVMAWRLLHRIKNEGWPGDLLDMMYLDDETLEWAKSDGDGIEADDAGPVHKDSNGVTLQAGDSVVLIKDLDVKGTSITAKRGAAVRSISLVHDNPEHIEGRVNGQMIVILTKFVKKT